MKKPLVIHPVLLAIYPVLFLFAHNISELFSKSLWLPLAISVCFTCISWLILNFFIKNVYKSGLVISLFLLLFFSYGRINNYIKLIFIIWPLIFCIITYFILRINKNIQIFTNLLNVITSVLLLISLGQICIYHVKMRSLSPALVNPTTEEKLPRASRVADALPNIFYIILDAYARGDVLEEIYAYDNSEFLNFLSQKGFYVAHQSRSNYAQTSLTLASSLDMRYLNDQVGTKLDITSREKRPLWEMISQSESLKFLQQMGYHIVTFSPYIPERIADRNRPDGYTRLSPGWTPDSFQNALINTTPIPALLHVLGTFNQFDLHRKKTQFIINHLADVTKLNPPLFVFARIAMPHPPFVFGPNGEERNPEEKFNDHDGDWLIRKGRFTRDQYVKGYVDQLIYINKQVKTMISKILADSKNPPIIILFADHGPRSMLVWEDPEKTYMKECMSILNAYYLPNGGDAHLYEDITPVNTFRVIFNHYFGTQYEIIEDESYFSTAQYCYKFYHVTDRIKNANNTIVHNHLGNDAIRQDDLEQAIEHFSEALKISPNNQEARINLSSVYLKQNKYREAIFHLKKAIQLEPQNHLLYNYLGVAHFKLNQFKEAIPNFEKAVEIKSDFVPAHINLGNALSQQGRLEDAIGHYDAALRLEPDHAEAHNNFGVALARQGKLHKAIEHFREAVRLKPNYREAQEYLRRALKETGKSSEASATSARSQTAVGG